MKDHIVLLRELTHDKNRHGNGEQEKKVEVHGQKQTTTRGNKKRNIRYTHKHGWARTTAEKGVFLHDGLNQLSQAVNDVHGSSTTTVTFFIVW